MSPEIKGRLFDPAAAMDRLRGIGDVTHRALKYCPTLTHAVIGAFAGAVMVGFTILAERSNQALPDTDRQYSREAISAGNKRPIDNPLQMIAGGAILFVVFGGPAGQRVKRGLEAFCPELKEPELNKPNSGLPPSGAADRI